MVNIGWHRIEELRDVVHQNLKPLALESMEIRQLCLEGKLAQEFAEGAECYNAFSHLKEKGLLQRDGHSCGGVDDVSGVRSTKQLIVPQVEDPRLQGGISSGGLRRRTQPNPPIHNIGGLVTSAGPESGSDPFREAAVLILEAKRALVSPE